MQVLKTRLDPRSEEYQSNRSAMEAKLAEFESLQEQARLGGGEKYIERHRARGKLLPRERIELLVDRDSPFLELSTLAAWGTDKPLGGNVVTGIGVVNGVECAILANDPTSQAGVFNRYTLAKSLRIMDIAMENRLPLLNLVESGGADLPDQADVFLVGGKWFRNLTRLSKRGIPTVAIVFGSSTAGGAYFPAMCDYAVMVREQAKVFLGGPPLVKMATGEESTDEELGGAEMHSRISGLSDYFADDEHEAIRMGRDIVAHFNWRKLGPGPTRDVSETIHDPDEILGVIPADLRVPFDMREILARVLDGSEFEEYKAVYGTSILNGWGYLHGYPLGVVANQQGVIFGDEAKKTTEFIQLCNRYDTPILFIHNTTGYMVGKEYEQAGIIKDGAKMINAVANSEVPHISLMAGVSYGAGNYGMSGRAYEPRFVFGYPNHKVSVMGAKQLAGVMSIVARQSAESRGVPFDEEADAARTAALTAEMEESEQAYFSTARVRDDGLIDPRETRTVLGIALSAIHSGPVQGTDRFGVFRM
ncbi:MAG TPA: carboxyl transferase domain-containing protein [Acidimicrobiia bacterium]|jgi:acetyl-CoA carboxylase carboxyltransferase component|nr:carboxyl transferase domain-containing protein [Acidimicrobiia bacterium]